MEFLASASGAAHAAVALFAEESAGFTINLFWVIVVAVNFIVFLGLIYLIFFKPVSSLLEERRCLDQVARHEEPQLPLG